MDTFKDISKEDIRKLPVYEQLEDRCDDSVLFQLELLAGTDTKSFSIRSRLFYCFDWESSPQGYGYWKEIDNL